MTPYAFRKLLKRLAYFFIGIFVIFYLIPRGEEPYTTTTTSSEYVKPTTHKAKELKYILLWTSPDKRPFVDLGTGTDVFVQKNCPYTNCFVTSDRNFLRDYTKFDVIAFFGQDVLKNYTKVEPTLPKKRSPYQKYVFVSIDPAVEYPACTDKLNGFFNWTWTYRLESDFVWRYIVVKDVEGNEVAPKKKMKWLNQWDMLPVKEDLRKILRKKKKAAAWFVSNCFTENTDRLNTAISLEFVMQLNYNQSVDIYGTCGKHHCPREKAAECNEMVRNDYFFYLVFENAFSEDYVTEKLLHAVHYNAIPIMYGGADYTRFLPKGSYLDAGRMNLKRLSIRMMELIDDFDTYVDYFKWTNHYSYHKADDICGICELLNNDTKVKEISVYDDFKNWWNSYDTLCRHKPQ